MNRLPLCTVVHVMPLITVVPYSLDVYMMIIVFGRAMKTPVVTQCSFRVWATFLVAVASVSAIQLQSQCRTYSPCLWSGM